MITNWACDRFGGF